MTRHLRKLEKLISADKAYGVRGITNGGGGARARSDARSDVRSDVRSDAHGVSGGANVLVQHWLRSC